MAHKTPKPDTEAPALVVLAQRVSFRRTASNKAQHVHCTCEAYKKWFQSTPRTPPPTPCKVAFGHVCICGVGMDPLDCFADEHSKSC